MDYGGSPVFGYMHGLLAVGQFAVEQFTVKKKLVSASLR